MLKILLVDDEPLFREGILQTIDWNSCEAEVPDEAPSGNNALKMMHIKKYDYVITDMIMPGMTGLEFLKMATKEFPSVNYIVLSGYDDFSYVKEAFQLGVVDYILKSEFSYHQLKNVIEKQRQIRNTVNTFYMTDSIGEVNLFYLKQGYLQNSWKDSDYIDTDSIRNIGFPLTEQDGLIYTAALRLHFSVEIVHQKDFKELKDQLMQKIDRCIMETKKFLGLEREGLYYLFYLSKDPMNWKELSEMWEMLRNTLCINLVPMISAISLGFSMQGTGLLRIREMAEDAAYYLSFYYIGGVGKLYSEPKVQTMRTSTNEKIPSLRGLVSGLYHLQYSQVADFLEQLTLDAVNVRGYEPITIANHFKDIYTLCNLFIETEGTLLGRELIDFIQEYQILEQAGSDVFALNAWVVHVAQMIRDQRIQSSRILLRVYTYIQEHYMYDISLESVAKELQLNPAYLSRVFSKESGIGFYTYLTKYRIDKAMELMADSNLKLYEIAETVGFNNSETFSRAFKRVKQISPQVYLKQGN